MDSISRSGITYSCAPRLSHAARHQSDHDTCNNDKKNEELEHWPTERCRSPHLRLLSEVIPFPLPYAHGLVAPVKANDGRRGSDKGPQPPSCPGATAGRSLVGCEAPPVHLWAGHLQRLLAQIQTAVSTPPCGRCAIAPAEMAGRRPAEASSRREWPGEIVRGLGRRLVTPFLREGDGSPFPDQ